MTAAATGITSTRWWWVRHAPVPDGGRIYGQRDLDCDCRERIVFDAVARWLPADAIWVTSTLKRTIQTADAIIAASSGRHTPSSISRYGAFAEQHLGDWQGQNREVMRQTLGITPMRFWLTRGDDKAPGGESFPDLVARVVPQIQDLTRNQAGRDIVAVTHGGTIRAAIQHAFGLGGETVHAFMIDNCSVTMLEHLRSDDGQSVWRTAGINHRPWEPR
jgi:alpha-ribazole phosphatase